MTGEICVTNSQAASHVSWLVRCSPHALGLVKAIKFLALILCPPLLNKTRKLPPCHFTTHLPLYHFITTLLPLHRSHLATSSLPAHPPQLSQDATSLPSNLSKLAASLSYHLSHLSSLLPSHLSHLLNSLLSHHSHLPSILTSHLSHVP